MSVTVDHSGPIWDIALTSIRARCRDILAGFVQRHGSVVQGGPFVGMTLPMRSSWGEGEMLPKLVGCYEAELHDAIQQIVADQPDLIIDVGAAEGYYPVGFARLLPNTRVHAFDIDETAQEVCREAARLNGVEAQISVAGRCSTDVLQLLLSRAVRPAVVCDCEGGEKELIDLAAVPALAHAMIVVERHEFIVASVTQTIVDRLSATHELFMVREGSRDPNTSSFLQHLSSLDRWISVCEFRPHTMHWLICKPRRSGG